MAINFTNDWQILLSDSKNEVLIDRRGASLALWQYDGFSLLRNPSADPMSLESDYNGRHAASYVVAGYFARLNNACINFEGQAYEMPAIPWEQDPVHQQYRLHGFAPLVMWDIVNHSKSSVTLKTPKNFLPANYHFPYESWVEYSLTNDGEFRVELGLKALRRGPYSLTWHPFWRRYLSSDGGGHIKAAFPAEGLLWGDMIPVPKEVSEIPDCWNYSYAPREVLAPYDSSYVGWNGSQGAEIIWPLGRREPNSSVNDLHLNMTSNAKVLHVFTNLEDSVCIEPTLCAANGFELADQGKLDRRYAGVLLDEGEETQLWINHRLAYASA